MLYDFTRILKVPRCGPDFLAPFSLLCTALYIDIGIFSLHSGFRRIRKNYVPYIACTEKTVSCTIEPKSECEPCEPRRQGIGPKEASGPLETRTAADYTEIRFTISEQLHITGSVIVPQHKGDKIDNSPSVHNGCTRRNDFCIVVA